MNEDRFNMELRKFLKNVGVTSQRAVETAVRDRGEAGKPVAGKLNARMVLTIPELQLTHEISGVIALD